MTRRLLAALALVGALTACGAPAGGGSGSADAASGSPLDDRSAAPAGTSAATASAATASAATATTSAATASPVHTAASARPSPVQTRDGRGMTITTTPAGTQPATPELQAAAGRGEPVDCSVFRCVALTFDDGPGNQTPQLLETLTSRDTPATFFFYGLWMGNNPTYVAQVANTPGMVVANHTVNHPGLSRVPLADARLEIVDNHHELEALGATDVTWLRPPYGLVNSDVAAACTEVGEAAITWNLDSLDYNDRDSASVTARVLAKAQAGSVVLMHDIHPWSVAAVPGIVDGLQAKGFLLVNLDQLLGPAAPGALYEIRDPSLIIR